MTDTASGTSVDAAELGRIPAEFRWGAATAAYQVEGASTADGRGPSIWDTFSHTPGRSLNGDTGDIAADHYHRYADDIDMMADFGLDSYRLSISWPRIMPTGSDGVNAAGLDHYERVVDKLLSRNIVPMITLYHWDLPQALDDAGGWLERDIAYRMADYSEVVLRRLSDRVPLWLTLNEPWTAAIQGYARGLHAPGIRDYRLAGTAIHHMMLGHGLTLNRFREIAPETAQIGITLSMAIVTPWSSHPADLRAAEVMDGEQNRVFLDPLFRGSYPSDMLEVFPTLVEEAVVHPGDLSLISADIDFLGVNYYMNNVVKADATIPLLGARLLQPPGKQMTANIAAVPEGLYDCLTRVHDEYRKLPMYVTEVGACFADYVDPNGAVNDPDRVRYLATCVSGIGKAIDHGADVRGLYVWSLLDNLEWELGYSIRFGLFYVDYATQKRIPKSSAYWYRDLIACAKAGS